MGRRKRYLLAFFSSWGLMLMYVLILSYAKYFGGQYEIIVKNIANMVFLVGEVNAMLAIGYIGVMEAFRPDYKAQISDEEIELYLEMRRNSATEIMKRTIKRLPNG